jgi:predicted AlkP superfamily phosphohydrolase/phosphomutase
MQEDSIQIALKKSENNAPCNEYIAAVQATLKKVTNDLLMVQWYINHGEDVVYWMNIRQILRERFLYIDSIRKNIEYSMTLFETNIFARFKIYLEFALVPYYDELINEKNNWDEQLPTYHLLVDEQMSVIDAIWQAQSFDEFLPLAQRYLYLRRELVWKLVL